MARRLSDSPRRRQDHFAVTDDRISDLPDAILGHILSFLPTRNAMSTSILSKRWKLLWTTSVNLDLCCPQNYTGAVEQFVRFVNYVLLLHKPAGYFNKLSLSWKNGCIPFHVNTWVSAAIVKDVRELFVCADIDTLPIQVQTYLFSSEKLQSLELKCNICISYEIVFSLPRLEHLKLISVYFQSENDFRMLVDGCPVLKCLVIHLDIDKMIGYLDSMKFKFIISSTSLRSLELYAYDHLAESESGTVLCDVQLDAPSLQYIKLEDHIRYIFVQQRLASLDEAIILSGGYKYVSGDEDQVYCDSLVEAFRAFDCAKALSLSDQVLQAFYSPTIKMKTEFTRLTRLEVMMYWKYWSSLLDFLKLSDSLEVLIVNEGNNFYFDLPRWKEPDVVPRCLSTSLKTVSISAYDEYRDELPMVEYILKHGSVLKLLDICFDVTFTYLNRKYELIEEISALPRKSRICKVKFRDRDNQQNAV